MSGNETALHDLNAETSCNSVYISFQRKDSITDECPFNYSIYYILIKKQ